MFAKILSLTLFAVATLASPAPIRSGDKFSLMSIRPSSAVHLAQFQAALGSIFLYLPSQNATCNNGTKANYATFTLSKDGALYLYSEHGARQQIYVDRSGMGQGRLGFTTGSAHGPRNGERKAFLINRFGDLTFNGDAFIACPGSIDEAWSVWVNVGRPNPGLNSGCIGFIGRTVGISGTPNSCAYTDPE
ncbi:hypothetical protein GGS21DRAFT_493703 [Xylaria nigripes]|nr:hypothetical protein GGS21DRAFT_493703 [Xylaria nigripes]